MVVEVRRTTTDFGSPPDTGPQQTVVRTYVGPKLIVVAGGGITTTDCGWQVGLTTR